MKLPRANEGIALKGQQRHCVYSDKYHDVFNGAHEAIWLQLTTRVSPGESKCLYLAVNGDISVNLECLSQSQPFSKSPQQYPTLA